MHERMQSSRKGRVFASGGLVVFMLTLGAPKVFSQTTPPGEAPPPAAHPREPAAGRRQRGDPTARLRPNRSRRRRPPPPAAPVELPFGVAPKGPVPPRRLTARDAEHRLRRAPSRPPFAFQGFSDPKNSTTSPRPSTRILYAGGQINRMWRWLLAITSDDYGGCAPPDEHGPGVRSSTRSRVSRPCPNSRSTPAACWSWPTATRRAVPGAWTSGSIPASSSGTPPAVPKAGPSGPRLGVAGLGRAVRRSHQVLPGRLSASGSGAVAAVQRSRPGQPALARARLVSAHDVLRRPRSRLHRHRRPDPEQRFGHDGAAMAGVTPPPPLLTTIASSTPT